MTSLAIRRLPPRQAGSAAGREKSGNASSPPRSVAAVLDRRSSARRTPAEWAHLIAARTRLRWFGGGEVRAQAANTADDGDGYWDVQGYEHQRSVDLPPVNVIGWELPRCPEGCGHNTFADISPPA